MPLKTLLSASRVLATLAAALVIAPAARASYTFVGINYPGSAFSIADGINDNGVITGAYYSTSPFIEQGFVYTSGSYSPLDAPGDAETELLGINSAGDIVGSGGIPVQGFEISGGTTTTVQDPNASSGVNQFAFGINDSGEISGSYGGVSGYVGYIDNAGTFTDLINSGESTQVNGINNSGEVVGGYGPSSSETAFEYLGGTYTDIPDPYGLSEIAYGINNSGDVVGSYISGGNTYGFVYAGGVYNTVDIPGSSATVLTGINDSGDISGFDINSGIQQGFEAIPNAPNPAPEPSPVVAMLAGMGAILLCAVKARCHRS